MPSSGAAFDQRGYFTIDGAASYLSVSRSRIYQHLESLDARRVGKRVLISRRSLDRLFASLNPVEPAGHRPLAIGERRRP